MWRPRTMTHSKWPMLVNHEADQKAHADESDEERDRGNEHAAARPVGNGGANQEAQAGQLQKHQQHDHDQAGENQQ